MNRLVLAFRSFFALLFHGALPEDVARELHLSPSAAKPAASQGTASKGTGQTKAAAPEPAAKTSDGALQMLAILQRDARLVDFLMEDISAYADDQIGAAVRELHDQCRDSMLRYVTMQPVIDGVEGTFAKAPSADPNVVKFVGNVPAKPPAGGTLRHKGWRAVKVDLPAAGAKHDATVIAPAEIEIE